MSMRSTKFDLEYSRFPLKLGLPPSPQWKRRAPAPGPGPGSRQRRSEQVDADANKRSEKAQGNNDGSDT